MRIIQHFMILPGKPVAYFPSRTSLLGGQGDVWGVFLGWRDPAAGIKAGACNVAESLGVCIFVRLIC